MLPDQPDFVQKTFVIFDMTHLIRIFMVSFQVPVGRGGEHVVDNRDAVIGSMGCIAVDNFGFQIFDNLPQLLPLFLDNLTGNLGVFGIEFDAIRVTSAAQSRHQRGPCACHRIEDRFPFLGEELDKFLCHRLWEFGRMDQHAFLARRRVMNEPGFLEFEPGFGIEVVEFVWTRHILFYISFPRWFRYAATRLLNQQYSYCLGVFVGTGVFVGGKYSTARTRKSEKVTVTGVSPTA